MSQTDTADKKLRECPFCESEDTAAVTRLGDHLNCFVWCATCRAEGPDGFATKAEAITAWNTRATEVKE